MFKRAFLSEYSLPDDVQAERILKAHLLSNEKLIIPAATVSKTSLSDVIISNLDYIGDGAIAIAHGNDCENLTQYIDKYPNVNWNSKIIEIFQYFDATNNRSIYKTSDTIEQFNSLMRRSAEGKNQNFNTLFENKLFSNKVLNSKKFNLDQYFSIIDNSGLSSENTVALKAHAKYFYNFFGAHSTEAGNTFSLENTDGFNYISENTSSFEKQISGLSILISCALDLTDGIDNFSYISDLDDVFLDKISFRDIMEIRKSWLHFEVLDKYDKLVQECAASYIDLDTGHTSSAIFHIENAFEIRNQILQSVKSQVKTEVNAYKFHRASRALADAAINFLDYLSGANLIRSVANGILSATTEVAVVFNQETKIKNLWRSKTKKIEKALEKGELIVGAKSPALEYLRLINTQIRR